MFLSIYFMKFQDQKTALIFTAHPDDHVCVAGTILYLKEQGYRIEEIIATGGELGAHCDEMGNVCDIDSKKGVAIRKTELSKAAALLGIDNVTQLGLEDGNIIKTPETIFKLMQIIRTKKPDLVLMHQTNDYHPDHVVYSLLVQEALQKAAWPMRQDLGESWRVPQAFMFDGLYITGATNTVVVTRYKNQIEEIMDVYRSQLYPPERQLLRAMREYYGFHTRKSRKDVEWGEGLTAISGFQNIGISMF